MGPDGDPDFDARWPDVAYSDARGEYLVVWFGDDDTGELVEGEWEVFGQRLVACPGDLNHDSVVGVVDLVALVMAWGPHAEHPGNLDGDGHVGITDLFKLFLYWGTCR